MSIVFSLFFSVLATTLLVPPLIKLGARFGMVDRPNARKVHLGVIPRSGGLAVIFGMLVPFAFLVKLSPLLLGVFLGACLILGTGLLDDLRGLGWQWKLAGQVAASLLTVYLSGLELDRPVEFWPGYLWDLDLISYPLSVLFLVACINCINLADGLDGLAGGMCLLIFASGGLLGFLDHNFPVIALSACMLGALVGFLRYNTHPAIVFLGDTGSQFLGFMVGVAMIALTHGEDSYSPVLCLYLIGIPALDMVVVMMERLLEKRPLFHPDRRHLHHKMLRLGFKHHQAVIVEYAVQLAMILIGWSLRQYPDYVLLYVYLALMGLAAAALLVSRRKPIFLPLSEEFINGGQNNPGSPPNGKAVVIFGCSRETIAHSSWYALAGTLLVYFFLSPLLVRPLVVELGFYSLGFMAILIAVKFFKHNCLSLSVKVAAYFSAISYILSTSQSPAGSWYAQNSGGWLILFLAMGVSYCCYLVFALEQMPTVTMDYLLLAVVVLTSFLPAPLLTEYRVHTIAAKILLVFLAIELVSFKLKDEGDLMLLWLLPSLGLNVVMAFWPLIG